MSWTIVYHDHYLIFTEKCQSPVRKSVAGHVRSTLHKRSVFAEDTESELLVL